MRVGNILFCLSFLWFITLSFNDTSLSNLVAFFQTSYLHWLRLNVYIKGTSVLQPEWNYVLSVCHNTTRNMVGFFSINNTILRFIVWSNALRHMHTSVARLCPSYYTHSLYPMFLSSLSTQNLCQPSVLHAKNSDMELLGACLQAMLVCSWEDLHPASKANSWP